MALTALGHVTMAEAHLKIAYEMALASHSPSTVNVCEAVLQAKKKRWETEEKVRLEHQGPLLAEVIEMFEEKYRRKVEELKNAGLSDQEFKDEKEYYENSKKEKIKELTTALSRHDERYKPRECPEYLLDPISFNLFVDPVISPSGQSYERAWILQHLKTSKTDPFSRQRLTENDLIPNLALRHAAEVWYSIID